MIERAGNWVGEVSAGKRAPYANMERVESLRQIQNRRDCCCAAGCDKEGRVCAAVVISIDPRTRALASALVDVIYDLFALNLPFGGSTGVSVECGGGREV